MVNRMANGSTSVTIPVVQVVACRIYIMPNIVPLTPLVAFIQDGMSDPIVFDVDVVDLETLVYLRTVTYLLNAQSVGTGIEKNV